MLSIGKDLGSTLLPSLSLSLFSFLRVQGTTGCTSLPPPHFEPLPFWADFEKLRRLVENLFWRKIEKFFVYKGEGIKRKLILSYYAASSPPSPFTLLPLSLSLSLLGPVFGSVYVLLLCKKQKFHLFAALLRFRTTINHSPWCATSCRTTNRTQSRHRVKSRDCKGMG